MVDRSEPIRALYAAFATGDGAALTGLLAEIDWDETPGMPYGGHYRGAEAVFANVFGPIQQDFVDFSAVPDAILPVGDTQVLAHGYYRGMGKAGPLEARFAHLWTLDGGSITHFVQFADSHCLRTARDG